MTDPIRPGENPDELLVFDHGFVRLDAAMADDLSVINSARVSFAVRKEEMDDRDKGLIKFLMRERHGCYDDKSEVLTAEGWKAWPDVTGEESFATMSPLGHLEYQPALRVVHKEYRGHMIGFKGMSIDQMVTPDHNVLVAQTTTRPQRLAPSFSLRPAHEVLWRSHRHIASATWLGADPHSLDERASAIPVRAYLKLVGFFIGDGHLGKGSHLQFHLRKDREINFLFRTVREARMEIRTYGDDHYVVPVSSSMRSLFASCYDGSREKRVPRVLLELAPAYLEALLDGLMNSDGCKTQRKHSDKWVYSTTSKGLADSVQELALKVGRTASIRPHVHGEGSGHYGSKIVYRVTIYQQRNTRPGLCRTRAEADNHMGVEEYNGNIHCVEVPNGTLYVRRNGYAVWSGNTPFEHNSFRFHVRTPMFVAREWFRHRISSFNEESARYHKLADDFYVPEVSAVRSQVGKPGAYTFEPVDEALALETQDILRKSYEQAYETYQDLSERGIAKEVARSVLPVGIYTQFYWTLNARSLMNFLSLRNAEAAQYEIRIYAEALERFFAQKMPVTHECFVEFGRKAP